MDPLSIIGSVIALIQLTKSVIDLLSAERDASRERHQCELEVKNLRYLLESLKDRCEATNSQHPWFTDVQGLAIPGGLFDQLRNALRLLEQRLERAKGLNKKAGETLKRKFNATDLEKIFSMIEGLKSQLQIALQNDQLSVLPILCQFLATLILAVNFQWQPITKSRKSSRRW
jgi:hypothetical protein